MTGAFRVLLLAALALALAFLTLPIVAIFVDTSPGDLIASLDDDASVDALLLSLETTTLALALIVIVGTPAAWFLATREFRGKAVVVTLVELPEAVEPQVTYGAGVVKGAPQPELAGAFVDGLTQGPCADALEEAGFGAVG